MSANYFISPTTLSVAKNPFLRTYQVYWYNFISTVVHGFMMYHNVLIRKKELGINLILLFDLLVILIV